MTLELSVETVEMLESLTLTLDQRLRESNECRELRHENGHRAGDSPSKFGEWKCVGQDAPSFFDYCIHQGCQSILNKDANGKNERESNQREVSCFNKENEDKQTNSPRTNEHRHLALLVNDLATIEPRLYDLCKQKNQDSGQKIDQFRRRENDQEC